MQLLARLRQVAADEGHTFERLLKGIWNLDFAGADPTEVYQPWLLMDALQQSLMRLNEATGDAFLSVVLVALLTRLFTWPWNRLSLQRRCDAVHLMPVYQEILWAYNDAQRRRGGAGLGAAGAQEAEADLLLASQRLKEFTEETKFFPLQGLGQTFLLLLKPFMAGYQFGFVLPVGFVYFGALYGILKHPD